MSDFFVVLYLSFCFGFSFVMVGGSGKIFGFVWYFFFFLVVVFFFVIFFFVWFFLLCIGSGLGFGLEVVVMGMLILCGDFFWCGWVGVVLWSLGI